MGQPTLSQSLYLVYDQSSKVNIVIIKLIKQMGKLKITEASNMPKPANYWAMESGFEPSYYTGVLLPYQVACARVRNLKI